MILANVVHDHSPLYSLLKCQCYWYSNTIFSVIANSYACEGVSVPEGYEMDDLTIPLNSYLPHLGGTWMGVNINTISNAVVEVMKENFQKHLEAVLTEVSIFYYKFFNLLNFEYR